MTLKYGWAGLGQYVDQIAASRLADEVNGYAGASVRNLTDGARRDAVLAELLATSTQLIGLGWVNPTDPAYGAMGDDTTDDTAALQAAITAAAHRVLYIPSGTYKTTSTLTIANQMTIVTAGNNPSATAICSIKKYHTGNAVNIQTGGMRVVGLNLNAATSVSATYAQGKGFNIDHSPATTPYGILESCSVDNIDGGALTIGPDQASQLQVVNFRAVGFTAGVDLIVLSPDTGARTRAFANITLGSGNFNASGAIDTWITNLFCRDLITDADTDILTFQGGRIASSVGPTFKGGSLFIHCAIGGPNPVTLDSSLTNSHGILMLTGGAAIVDNSGGINNFFFKNGSVWETTSKQIRYKNQSDVPFILELQAGSTTDQAEQILFKDKSGTTIYTLQKSSGNQWSLSDTVAAKSVLNAIPNGNTQLNGVGSGGVQLNAGGSGTGGVQFYDGAASPTLVASVSSAGLATMRRVAGSGTAHVAGDYVASANWGTTPTITPTARDSGGRVSVLAQATTGANPTLTLTFKDGTWTTIPAISCSRGDVAAPTTGFWALTTPSATAPVFTFVGTPTAGNTYILDFTVIGK